MSRFLATTLLLATLATPAAAQDWRTISASRQVTGEKELEVDVEYGAGRLLIAPATTPNTLYRTALRYDASSMRPVTSYKEGKLRVGVDELKHISKGGNDDNMGRLELALGPSVPLDFEATFGAAEADIELGGLKLTHAHISTGASETKLRFSKPNQARLEELLLHVGAAEFRTYGLGNANAAKISLAGGVGDISLDFTGDWRADTELNVQMGLGSLELVLPRSLGVRVVKSSVLLSFDGGDFVKRGSTYTSENWQSARRKLTVRLQGALGSVDVRWVNNSSTF